MTTPSFRVLISDDHELIREGLKRILLDSGAATAVGEARNSQETMAVVRLEKWDVVILDINLEGRSGLDVLKEIRSEFPRLPVLVLSMYPEEQFALRVIRAGANGYLNKNLTPQKLIEAIQQVLTGGHYFSPSVAEQLLNAVQHPGNQPLHTTLSDREDQTLRLLSEGRAVGEIAALLNLSVKTVSTYRGIALRKLGLKNNAQLMRYAQMNGMVE